MRAGPTLFLYTLAIAKLCPWFRAICIFGWSNQKLQAFLGDSSDLSYVMATCYMYFPFLPCEVKCGAEGLDVEIGRMLIAWLLQWIVLLHSSVKWSVSKSFTDRFSVSYTLTIKSRSGSGGTMLWSTQTRPRFGVTRFASLNLRSTRV